MAMGELRVLVLLLVEMGWVVMGEVGPFRESGDVRGEEVHDWIDGFESDDAKFFGLGLALPQDDKEWAWNIQYNKIISYKGKYQVIYLRYSPWKQLHEYLYYSCTRNCLLTHHLCYCM